VWRRRFMESSCPSGRSDSHTSWTNLRGSGHLRKPPVDPAGRGITDGRSPRLPCPRSGRIEAYGDNGRHPSTISEGQTNAKTLDQGLYRVDCKGRAVRLGNLHYMPNGVQVRGLRPRDNMVGKLIDDYRSFFDVGVPAPGIVRNAAVLSERQGDQTECRRKVDPMNHNPIE
jgi:hypothetical protein